MRLRLERSPWAWFGFGILGFACQGSANVSVGSRAALSPAASSPNESPAARPPAERPAASPDAGPERMAAEQRGRREPGRRSQRRNDTRERRLVLPGNLVFRTGSAQLTETPQNEEILAQLVTFLEEHPEVTLFCIEGHTDAVGDAAANLELSGQRALTIKRALTARQVAPERLVAVGFGEAAPLASNDSSAGRALNRRTEFRIAEIHGKPTSNLGPLAGGTEFK